MTNQDAIDALALQQQRFTDLMRSIDGGIWWSSHSNKKLNVDEIKYHADMIGNSLDKVTSLLRKIAA
ncbi:hypothetical protein [Methylobacterium sp. CM6257]